MKKKTKGLAAIVLGGALVLGTGGTFAVWQADHFITGGTINTGRLALSGADDFTWTHDAPGGVDFYDPEFPLVPGQTLYGVADINVDLLGRDLVANLTVEDFRVDVDGEEIPPAGDTVRGVTVTWSIPEDGAFRPADPGALRFLITITVDENATGDNPNVSQDLPVNVNDITVFLQQDTGALA